MDKLIRFKALDKADLHRPAEDVAYAVARFFMCGGALQNYYMVNHLAYMQIHNVHH